MNLLYILIVVCTHGPDNKQLLAEVAVHETMERCKVTEDTVYRQLGQDCKQLATNCVERKVVK